MGADREPDEVYAAKQKLGPFIQGLLDSCCKDQPETLQPWLLAKLVETYPAGAKGLKLEPEATAALAEQCCYKRPGDAKAFMIEILAAGDAFTEMEVTADADAAAAKMQALQRGRMERKKRADAKAAEKAAEKKEMDAAAAKMQAARRGHADRKVAKELQLEKEMAKKAEREAAEAKAAAEAAAEAAKQAAAATKMQAIQRGNMARMGPKTRAEAMAEAEAAKQAAEAPPEPAADELPSSNPETDAAAAKLQAVQRGKKERDAYLAAKKEREAAAVKMQSMQRGKNARKKLGEA
ncbi:hypothetical protein Ctob_008618 [Chrysochromulina tobinii]|uniref:Uncharacterized protein n=1 Tax=Chrysochromulina tobinii TaxID=1460289 RepID=A0A0M0JF26_9EUKA|nr:hypothetical protein Ctob_008618 [Chrysochromulina tobinii]|eukprot:KOO24848.1 hypothetical protein Ctob_008618 [Chrysochromulina sp. CCMP291]